MDFAEEGGDPTNADSDEQVVYCKLCGIEKSPED